jgi:hypothetical protein
MSTARVSKSQPQGPAFSEAPKAPKAPKAPAKAPEAPKAPKVATGWDGLEQTPLYAKGSSLKAKCQVMVKPSKQCSNPANYPFLSHTTCRTHLNRLVQLTPAGLAKVRFAKVAVDYDPSLWGAPKVAPEAPKAPAKAKAKTPKAKAPEAMVMGEGAWASEAPQAPSEAPSKA